MIRRSPLPFAAALLLVSGCRSNEAPGAFDPTDIRGYLSRLNRSHHPEAVRIRKELSGASAMLSAERSGAAADGIPTVSFEASRPRAFDNADAAPLYESLHSILAERPLDPPVRSGSPFGRAGPPVQRTRLTDAMGPRTPYSREQIESARFHLADRREIIDLIHRASEMPECRFRLSSDPMRMDVPEASAIHVSLRILSSESYLLAREGRFEAAIKNQARGFRLARHSATPPTVTALIEGTLLETRTLKRLEELVEMAPNRPEVARMARDAVSRYRNTYNLRHALSGELAVYHPFHLDALRANPEGIAHIVMIDSSAQVKPIDNKLTASERRFALQIIDLAEARLIAAARRMLRAEQLPDPQRAVELRAVMDDFEQLSRSGDPTAPLLRLLSSFAIPGLRTVEMLAQQNVTLAALAIMEYHARTGRFPEKLTEAIVPAPRDPFTGGSVRYQLEANGFVVFSAGRTGRFAGGKPEPRAREAWYRFPPEPVSTSSRM